MNAAYIVSLWLHNYVQKNLSKSSLPDLPEHLHKITARNYKHWVGFHPCLLWELERR